MLCLEAPAFELSIVFRFDSSCGFMVKCVIPKAFSPGGESLSVYNYTIMRCRMKKELLQKSEIKLVGLTARTNNSNEMNPLAAKIGALASSYWSQNVAGQIANRKSPGVTLSVYTEYEGDEHGDYTYFIGEEVSSFDNTPSGLQELIIPAAKYQKFTTPEGAMPAVDAAWQQIWKMSPDDFGGRRAYRADFELYDQRANNPASTSLDIYIGIE